MDNFVSIISLFCRNILLGREDYRGLYLLHHDGGGDAHDRDHDLYHGLCLHQSPLLVSMSM